MNLYPEVFNKNPATADKGISPEPFDSPQIRPNVKIRASHVQIQTISIPLPDLTANDTEPEHLTFSPKDKVIKMPAPPVTQSILVRVERSKDSKQDRRIGFKPPPLKPQPVRSVTLRRTDNASTSFENQEIKDKVKSDSVTFDTLPQQIKRPSSKATVRHGKTDHMRRLLKARDTPRQTATHSSLITPTGFYAPSGTVHYTLGEAQLPAQFALPMAYVQALGRPVTESELKETVLQIVRRLFKQVKGFKVSQHADTMDFYALSYGENTPISECCKAALLLQLCKDSGGKVLCTARQCYIRHLHNFLLSVSERECLWKAEQAPQSSERSSKAVSMEIQRGGYKARSLRAAPKSARRSVSPHRELMFTNEKLQHIRTRSDARPFDMKDCPTFQPPSDLRAFSPLRQVLARGGRRAGLVHSLEELESVWRR